MTDDESTDFMPPSIFFYHKAAGVITIFSQNTEAEDTILFGCNNEFGQHKIQRIFLVSDHVFTKHNHIPSGASLIETVFPVIFDLPVSLGFVIVYSSPLEEEKIFFGQYLSYLRILPLV